MRKKRKKQTIFEVCVHNQEDKEKYSRANRKKKPRKLYARRGKKRPKIG